MGHIYLSHSHPIAIYACPIPWDVSHGIPMDKPVNFALDEVTEKLKWNMQMFIDFYSFLH